LFFPWERSHFYKKENNNFKKLRPERFVIPGISFADLMIREKTAEEGTMSRLIQYFKNRQVRKHMKIRIKVWLLSESVEEVLPIAAFPVKH
jgi:hypothetical protein